jgi:hypothetical protein
LEVGIGRAKFFGFGVLCLVADLKVVKSDLVFRSVGVQAAAKISRHAAQLFLGEGSIGVEFIPQSQKTSAGLAHGEIASQRDAIHTVIGSVEQISNIAREVIRPWHEPDDTQSRLFAEG